MQDPYYHCLYLLLLLNSQKLVWNVTDAEVSATKKNCQGTETMMPKFQ